MATDPSSPFLEVAGLSKRFGITQALSEVSVSFRAGEVHALMGENGAGKSTLGKTIAGLHEPDAGRITLGGRVLPPGDLQAAFDAGIRIVHQELSQCPNLTVAENLCLHRFPRTRLGLVDRREMARRARILLDRIETGIDPEAPLGSLSPGRRQIVQIASALEDRGGAAGGSKVKVVVFDEPTSSLSAAETERLLAVIRQLAADGLCCIYVSHRMAEIFAVCDRATVLRDGRFVATTPIKELDEPTLVEQMIGRRLDGTTRRAAAFEAAAAPVLEVRGMSSPGKLSEVSISVRAGEVLGIGGLVGSGRSELLDAVFGLDARANGRVSVGGKDVRRGSPRHAMRAGIGYVPEDRRLQGLFFQMGVRENILLPVMPSLARAGVRSMSRERDAGSARMRGFQVKAASPSALPGSLSGGNQQKLLLARWMSDGVKVLLLDEPTRGIDVGTKAEVYKLIRSAADRGAAVVLVSSEMAELLALSDRIAVLAGGRLKGELKGEDMTQASILRLAAFEAKG